MIKLNRLNLVMICLILVGLLFLASLPSHAITLKKETVIEDDYLRLGHVFEGLTDHKDYILAPAPVPGNKTILNAYSLNTIAKAFGLPWQAPNHFSQAVIKRSATIVDYDTIVFTLAQELKDKLPHDQFRVELSNRSTSMVLPSDYAPTIHVKAMTYDNRRQVFTADIQGSDNSTMTVNGRVVHTLEVPVLQNNMKAGDVVTAENVAWIEVDENQLSQNTVIDIEQLLGMTPRRFIRQGSLIQNSDIKQPFIVNKGETVTIVYQSNSIEITAKGRALDSGARGDIVRVMNPSSNRVFDATVDGAQLVSILPAMKAAL